MAVTIKLNMVGVIFFCHYYKNAYSTKNEDIERVFVWPQLKRGHIERVCLWPQLKMGDIERVFIWLQLKRGDTKRLFI